MSIVDQTTIETLKEIMGDDFKLLIETFLTDAQMRVEQLQSMRSSTDSDALRKASHSLKGSCANIGAQELAALCQHIENAAADHQLTCVPSLLDDITHMHRQVDEVLQTYLKNL